MINIFHGEDLDQTFENACAHTLANYQVKDCKVNFINNEYVIVVKTEKVAV
ncbi:hypothetical protein LFYK43_13520 [Ligilactobacillus salitolerans]|uniref:Uncharacterized protein n=1 Tax=Ligilactobacillus salitolerans TaxID=1808352 RepID=A0A401ITL7_9LACO|nr:hypothetical protein [Ligilactobacillus salitolerans]GBG94893.1 hypothetical protein LFYK43_13520 [Ligilactobacillus salitolerans]